MFIIWYCRANARRHDGTAELVHDVTGLHTSTDAQTHLKEIYRFTDRSAINIDLSSAVIVICISFI